jgi:hypothetical protein
MVSVSAAIATAEFNKQWLLKNLADMWSNTIEYGDLVDYIDKLKVG